ncbi:MAG: ribonuclease Z [Bacteroidia bacterium]
MFRVQVLGTGSAVPTFYRGLSAQVVTYNDRHYLIDCGEGTQVQIMRCKIKLHRLDAIFISHLHGDHVLGLPGLLSSLSMEGRETALKLYAPAALKSVLELILQQTHSYLSYPLQFIPTEDFAIGSELFATDALTVRALPLTHRIFCRGFRFEEVNKKPKFDFYKAKALEVPNPYFHLLKQGNSITLENGEIITPDMVLLPPDAPHSYCYCSDTAYYEKLIPYIHQTSLLYHEATFTEELKKRAKDTAHSTAKQAATIALKADVKRLLLGHFSARYTDLTPLWNEARAVFPNTYLAEDTGIYEIDSDKGWA